MGVTNTLNKKSERLIKQLSSDYPSFKFKVGKQEHWSPMSQTITYNPNDSDEKFTYGILHELAHALLGHSSYESDFELVRLESEAWALAVELAKNYSIEMDDDHIQNCLDTYRDWLHRRSTCPKCGLHVLQKSSSSYQCFNCKTDWSVSSGRFARPYRQTKTARI
jgi:hypothetical protein